MGLGMMSKFGLCFEELIGGKERKQARMVLGVFNLRGEQIYVYRCMCGYICIGKYIFMCVYILKYFFFL